MSREGSEHVTRFAFENAGAHARAQRLAWFGSCLSRAHDLQHTAVRTRAMYISLSHLRMLVKMLAESGAVHALVCI